MTVALKEFIHPQLEKLITEVQAQRSH